jgi:hypothetical protein
MDGERAVLEGLVLPELRARLHGQGIEIVVVDPAKETGEAWDLALRFQEIEKCQIFVGLLGERYGAAPKTIPLSLVSAEPWLGEDSGRSVLEVEILHGALRESGTTRSFFYFRNPQFPSIVPATLRRRFLSESVEALNRLEGLKNRIRSSGRPVFDGYPCAWSEGLERASRLDTFAEQVFEDLWYAIQELVRQEAEGPPVALAPSSPEATASTPIRSSSRRGLRTGLGVAATITLVGIGLGLFALSRQTATRPSSIPVSVAIRRHADPPVFPILTQETWQRLAAACQIGPNNARAIPTRAPAGSAMVQVFASTDEADAGQALARYSSRRGFLLPQEENGRAVCTVVLGPFASAEAASRAAAELRMSDGTDAKVVAYPGFTK